MQLSKKKSASAKSAKRPAPVMPELQAKLVQKHAYIPSKVFENDALWHVCALSWKMAVAGNQAYPSILQEIWDSPELVTNMGLNLPKASSNAITRLNRICERFDALLNNPAPEGVFTKNLRSLCEFFELPEDFIPILRFAVLLQTSRGIEHLNTHIFESFTFEQWADAIAGAIGVTPEQLLQSLAQDSPLVKSGLIEVEEFDQYSTFIEVQKGFARKIRYIPCSIDDLLSSCIDPAPEPELAREDFAHLSELWNSLEAALRSTTPCHILLSGLPGTGKTQFALALCKANGLQASMVKSEDERGNSIEGHQRRIALKQGHHLVMKLSKPLLIVDEAENILDSDPGSLELGRERAPSGAKAWVNRFLETSDVPTIWIVNSPEVLDPSILRRFTWVAPIPIPPRSARASILRQRFSSQPLSEELLDELASRSDLPPYEAKRLAKIAQMCPQGCDREQMIRQALELADELFNRKPTSLVKPVTAFDANLLNLNVDLERLLSGLSKHGQGRIGFFGPPGTGKTMLASEIARRLERNLLLRSGSDLLAPYVGQTEQNIARAFEEARDENAVLFFDEVDSIAGDRGSAHQSWERSNTNELLVRLERFQGIVILATNHRSVLDAALSRRIDQKIEFGDLLPDQARALFLRHASKVSADQEAKLGKLRLRLGDFAAVLRGLHALDSASTPEALLKALEAEVTYRGDKNARRLGL